MNLLAVALGGSAGALLRYGTNQLALRFWGGHFPWGTLGVNVIGSFAIGIGWQLFERWEVAPPWRGFVLVGVLGAFTTFSSFSLDSLRLFQTGRPFLGILNILGNNVLGFTAVLLGVLLTRRFLGLLDVS